MSVRFFLATVAYIHELKLTTPLLSLSENIVKKPTHGK